MGTDLVKMIDAYHWITPFLPGNKVHIMEAENTIPAKVRALCGKSFVTGAKTWDVTHDDQYNHQICMQCRDLLRCLDASAALYALEKLLDDKSKARNPAITQQIALIRTSIKFPTSLHFIEED